MVSYFHAHSDFRMRTAWIVEAGVQAARGCFDERRQGGREPIRRDCRRAR